MRQHIRSSFLFRQRFLLICSFSILFYFFDICENLTISLKNYTLPSTFVSDVLVGVLPRTGLSPSFLTLSGIPFGLTRRSVDQYQNDLILTLTKSYTLINLDNTLKRALLYNTSKSETFSKNNHLTKLILNDVHFTSSHHNGTNGLKHGAILIVIEEDKIVELFTKSYIFSNVFCPYSSTKTPIIFDTILEDKTSPYAYLPILSSPQTFVINFHRSTPYLLVMLNCFNTTERISIGGNITLTNSYGTLSQNDISKLTCHAISSIFFFILFLLSCIRHIYFRKLSKPSRFYFLLPSLFLFLQSFFIWNILVAFNFTNHFSSFLLIMCSLTSSLAQIIFYSLCFLVIKSYPMQNYAFHWIEYKFVLFVLFNFFIFETIRQSMPPYDLIPWVFLVNRLSVFGSLIFKIVIIFFIYKEYYLAQQMSHQGVFYPSKFFLTKYFVRYQTILAILAILTGIVDNVYQKRVNEEEHYGFIFSDYIPSFLWAMAVICLLYYSERIYVVNEAITTLKTTIQIPAQSKTPSFELQFYQPTRRTASKHSFA